MSLTQPHPPTPAASISNSNARATPTQPGQPIHIPPPQEPASKLYGSRKRRREDIGVETWHSAPARIARSEASVGSSAGASSASDPSNRGSVSRAVKDRILAVYKNPSDGDTRCWNCGASPCEVAHVVANKDPTASSRYAEGRLSFININNENNLIPLCPLCRTNFDRILLPGFVFLPTDLLYFVEWELKDFEERGKQYERNGIWRQRSLPSIASYQQHCSQKSSVEHTRGGTYVRYTLRDFYPTGVVQYMGKNPYPQQKEWHGYPEAALHRAFQAFALCPKALPSAVYDLLSQLNKLYARDLEPADTSELGDDNESPGLSDDSDSPRPPRPPTRMFAPIGSSSLSQRPSAAESNEVSFSPRSSAGNLDQGEAKETLSPLSSRAEAPTYADSRSNKRRVTSARKKLPDWDNWPTTITEALKWPGLQPLPMPPLWKYGPAATSQSAIKRTRDLDGEDEAVGPRELRLCTGGL